MFTGIVEGNGEGGGERDVLVDIAGKEMLKCTVAVIDSIPKWAMIVERRDSEPRWPPHFSN